MKGRYLIVDKGILPDYFDKVVEAKKLVKDGKVKNISEAIKKVGISRNTYYKYKEHILELNDNAKGKKAIISMVLVQKVGILSTVMNIIAYYSFGIWTINQNPPVNSQANVIIVIELDDGTVSIDDMLNRIREIDGVIKAHLVGIE